MTTETSEQNTSANEIHGKLALNNQSGIVSNDVVSTTPKHEGFVLERDRTFSKDTIASKMKKRLASMSKDRQNESISVIYAKREHNPEDRLDQIGVRPKNFYEDRTDLHDIESI